MIFKQAKSISLKNRKESVVYKRPNDYETKHVCPVTRYFNTKALRILSCRNTLYKCIYTLLCQSKATCANQNHIQRVREQVEVKADSTVTYIFRLNLSYTCLLYTSRCV